MRELPHYKKGHEKWYMVLSGKSNLQKMLKYVELLFLVRLWKRHCKNSISLNWLQLFATFRYFRLGKHPILLHKKGPFLVFGNFNEPSKAFQQTPLGTWSPRCA